MRIGVLTGGGDCPGLNAVIRAIVRKGINAHGHEFFGFRYGWAGVLNNEGTELNLESTRGILHRGGTILGSSRTNVYKVEDGLNKVKAAMEAAGPRRADPDRRRGHARRRRASCTRTASPSSACRRRSTTTWRPPTTRSASRPRSRSPPTRSTACTPRPSRTTACSSSRSWAATPAGSRVYSGIAGGADVILIPERPFDIDEVCEHLKRRHARGTTFSIVVVAEGATPKDGGLLTAAPDDGLLRPRAPRRHRARAREGDRGAHRASSRA